MDSCPLMPILNQCPLNQSSWSNGSDLHHFPASLHMAAQEDVITRSHILKIFRKATVSHGFGSEYQSELKTLLGQNWFSSWTIWMLAVPGTMLLGLVGNLLAKSVFGRLRMSERQKTRETLWNYAFFKFVFIFGVVNVDSMEEIALWMDWFVLLGFIHYFIVLTHDRCEYITFSPTRMNTQEDRIVFLLSSIIAFSSVILGCGVYLISVGLVHTGLFAAAEAALIFLPASQVLLRCCAHRYRIGSSTARWEKRTGLFYYVTLLSESGAILVDLFHHAHMLYEVGNFSASSFIVVKQLFLLVEKLMKRYRRHRNYVVIQSRLQSAFSPASKAEIDHHDGPCSICWDKLEEARKLNCGHLFHETCLLSWLEQDVSCPICRVSLDTVFKLHERGPGARRPDQEAPRVLTFEGSRFNRWLPNISLNVTHPVYEYVDSGDYAVLAERVRQVFPHIPQQSIMEDLLETGSADITIEKILSGSFKFFNPARSPTLHRASTENSTASTPETPITDAVLESPAACRVIYKQRKEAALREARKKFLVRLINEKKS